MHEAVFGRCIMRVSPRQTCTYRPMARFMQHIRTRQENTVVLCSHVLHQLETVCQRYVIIDRGRTVAQGTLPELADMCSGPTVVEVETDYALEGATYDSVPAKRLPAGRIQFTVSGRDEVPGLIRRLSQDAEVYSVELKGRDLQSVYFKLLEGASNE
jgi:ABC-2 type transport system ATP-binding protein